MPQLIFLDTETTGNDVAKDRRWAITCRAACGSVF